MLGAKNILTPLIPDCSVLRTLTILKNIRNPLIFLRKMATYSCFWRVPSSEIFLQASLRQISDLLTLVSSHYGDGDPSGIPVPCIYLHDLYNHLVSMIYSLFVTVQYLHSYEPKCIKITFGDGILACMSRDFDIFMSKHLAGQWLPNSYLYSY